MPEIIGPRAPARPTSVQRPLAPRRPPEPPIPWPTYSVELQVRLGLPLGSSFDDALAAHRYGGPSIAPTSYVGVAFPLPVEWLWLGGRLGVRGRVWDHPDRDPATLIATDLLLTAQVRLWLGNVVELGVLFAGGAGWMEVNVNGVGSNQVVGRFGLEATLSFKIGRNFAFGPRIGWDYFQWDGMNAYGHDVDAGGAVLAIGLEGRE